MPRQRRFAVRPEILRISWMATQFERDVNDDRRKEDDRQTEQHDLSIAHLSKKGRHVAPFGLEIGCGGRIRTDDLRVMSPTSCRCSTPRSKYTAALKAGRRGLSECEVRRKEKPPVSVTVTAER